MPNINALRPVVHERKIYQNFPYWAPYSALKGASPFISSPEPRAQVSYSDHAPSVVCRPSVRP